MDDFGFPIVTSPWLSGDVPSLQSYGFAVGYVLNKSLDKFLFLKSSNSFKTLDTMLQIHVSQASVFIRRRVYQFLTCVSSLLHSFCG